MPVVNVSLDTSELDRALELLSGPALLAAVRRGIERSLPVLGAAMKREVARRAPVRTGRLRRSIRYDVDAASYSRPATRVGLRIVWYGAMVNARTGFRDDGLRAAVEDRAWRRALQRHVGEEIRRLLA